MSTGWKIIRRNIHVLLGRTPTKRRASIIAITLTVLILLISRQPWVASMLLLIPISYIAWHRGLRGGVVMAIIATLLTSPIPILSLLLQPQFDIRTWYLVGIFHLIIGVVMGWYADHSRAPKPQQVYADIQEKLQHAQASAARYEVLLSQMKDSQELLKRMNDELALLNTLATAVNSSLNVNEVQSTAFTLISTLMDIDEIQTYLMDDDTSELVLLTDDTDGYVEDVRVSLTAQEGVFARIMHSQRSEFISADLGELSMLPCRMGDSIRSAVAVPLRSRSQLRGVMIFGRKSAEQYSTDDERFLESVGRVLAIAMENAMMFEQAQGLSLSDELTGLGNRRMFNLSLLAEINRAKASNSELHLVIFDLDHFKRVNDRYGHLVGDSVLQQFARQVLKDIRGSDLFCRFGGEEFALVVPDTPLSITISVIERICRKISQTPFDVGDGSHLSLTVSAGVANIERGIESSEELIEAADQALYAAKSNGRNRVEVYHVLTLPSARQKNPA